jgi:hypothetical protein
MVTTSMEDRICQGCHGTTCIQARRAIDMQYNHTGGNPRHRVTCRSRYSKRQTLPAADCSLHCLLIRLVSSAALHIVEYCKRAHESSAHTQCWNTSSDGAQAPLFNSYMSYKVSHLKASWDETALLAVLVARCTPSGRSPSYKSCQVS